MTRENRYYRYRPGAIAVSAHCPGIEKSAARIEAAFGEDRLQAPDDLLADICTTLEQQEAIGAVVKHHSFVIQWD